MKFIFLFFILFAQISSAETSKCPSGQYFVNTYKRNAYYRTDGTYVKETTVSAHCRTNHFFNPLKLVFEDTMPGGWPFQLEIFKSPSENEKKEIESAINSLPKTLKDLGEIRIFRAVKSAFPDNHSSSGPDDSIIVLYDSVFKFGLKRALVHEMAHVLYSHLDKNEKEDYRSISKWNEIEKDVFHTPRTQFSEPDGKLSPEEDFANNVEHLISDKNHSKVIDKEIMNYLRSLLGIIR
jgi:hypothetical protein